MISGHTVEELVQTILRLYGSGSVQYETQGEKLHEASFLQLDISKAVASLKWKPVLRFNESAEFTVDGYRDDLSDDPVYHKRIRQLVDYVRLAQDREIGWAVSGHEEESSVIDPTVNDDNRVMEKTYKWIEMTHEEIRKQILELTKQYYTAKYSGAKIPAGPIACTLCRQGI